MFPPPSSSSTWITSCSCSPVFLSLPPSFGFWRSTPSARRRSHNLERSSAEDARASPVVRSPRKDLRNDELHCFNRFFKKKHFALSYIAVSSSKSGRSRTVAPLRLHLWQELSSAMAPHRSSDTTGARKRQLQVTRPSLHFRWRSLLPRLTLFSQNADFLRCCLLPVLSILAFVPIYLSQVSVEGKIKCHIPRLWSTLQ